MRHEVLAGFFYGTWSARVADASSCPIERGKDLPPTLTEGRGTFSATSTNGRCAERHGTPPMSPRVIPSDTEEHDSIFNRSSGAEMESVPIRSLIWRCRFLLPNPPDPELRSNCGNAPAPAPSIVTSEKEIDTKLPLLHTSAARMIMSHGFTHRGSPEIQTT